MNWYVYKKDDPSTWPEIDCQMLVYVNNSDYHEFLTIAEWVTWCHIMYDTKTDEFLHTDECYYAYIAYVPNGYKVFHPIVCTDETGHSCDYYDGGYCMEHGECMFKQVSNEYGLNDMKKIWKEFE